MDTSSASLEVLAVNEKKVSKRRVEDASFRHSVMLMDEVDRALEETALKPEDCDFFCAVVGPGSFTGIRIGISAAKGFSMATGKKLLGVSAFDLLAADVSSDDFAVVIDAGRDAYYVQRITDGVKGAPSYMKREEVEEMKVPLFGSEDLALPSYVRKDRNLLGAVEKSLGNLSDNISALYIRKSQAEEGRP